MKFFVTLDVGIDGYDKTEYLVVDTENSEHIEFDNSPELRDICDEALSVLEGQHNSTLRIHEQDNWRLYENGEDYDNMSITVSNCQEINNEQFQLLQNLGII